MSGGTPEIWIRYELVGDGYVFRCEHPIEKSTPAGVRLSNGKFVAHHWHKKYAHPTDAEAREGFLIRRRRELQHLERRIANVRACLSRPDPFENPAVEVFETFGFDQP